MTLALSTPVTGGAQTGLTSPTYTLSTDAAPTNTGKQYAVSALGGTQAGVDTSSSPSRPFTITLSKPPVLRGAPAVNQVTGLLGSVPRNTYKIIGRKGVTVVSGQAPQVMNVTVTIDVPAGADSADAANVRALLSLVIGSMNQVSAGIGDTCVTGIS